MALRRIERGHQHSQESFQPFHVRRSILPSYRGMPPLPVKNRKSLVAELQPATYSNEDFSAGRRALCDYATIRQIKRDYFGARETK